VEENPPPAEPARPSASSHVAAVAPSPASPGLDPAVAEPKGPPTTHRPVAVVGPRWVPLVPGGEGIPPGMTGRSGAVLMAATRADGTAHLPPRPTEADGDLRSALVSCIEALVPQLEAGWSSCREHPSCRAVQEASGVLWGSDTPSSEPPRPAGPGEPGIAPASGSSPTGAEETFGPGEHLPVMTRNRPSEAGP